MKEAELKVDLAVMGDEGVRSSAGLEETREPVRAANAIAQGREHSERPSGAEG